LGVRFESVSGRLTYECNRLEQEATGSMERSNIGSAPCLKITEFISIERGGKGGVEVE